MNEVPWLNNYLEKKESFGNPLFVDRVFKKAEEAKAIDTTKMEDFSDLYDVERDKAYVDRKEKVFAEKNTKKEEENKKIATILEAVLHEQIEQNEYLGENVTTISTCKFDDIKNGIDGILEIEDEENKTAEHLAIAIDATFNADINKKIERIKKAIEKGKLAKIKYFKSDFLDFRGEKSGIPKFVLGIDKKHLEGVAKLWINGQQKKLSQHPLQIVIFNEILIQTEYFQKYAESIGNSRIAKKYEEIYKIFQKIKEEKKSEWEEILADEKNQKIIDDDQVYQAIENLEFKKV